MRSAVLLLSMTVALAAQAAPPASDAEAAVRDAARFLVSFQEHYEADPPVGRFRTQGALEKWQAEEEIRLEKQRQKGRPLQEWPYEGVYRVAGTIPPGYRVGGTAIVCWALMESPEFDQAKDREGAVARGLGFILDAFDQDRLLDIGFRGTYDVRGWAHAYGLFTLVKALNRGVLEGKQAERARKRCRWLVKALEDTEIPGNGGWNYARGRGGAKAACAPSSFMTASTLLSLYEAQAAGFDVDAGVVERALAALERGRAENGAFEYGIGRGGPGGQKTPGACARMSIAETALYLAGRSNIEKLRQAVRAFFEHWDDLEKRRGKQGTHEGPYHIAPYYFHYGHTYVAQAIELLPEKERPALRASLQKLYLKTREKDGSWNDRIFPRSKGYCTAMALLGLHMPHVEKPAAWKPQAQAK